MPFKNRWRIEATLTAKTPIHVGNGEVVHRRDVFKDKRDGTGTEPVEINAVATDSAGRAYLPGSTLKGVLRDRLRRRGIRPDLVDRVFGDDRLQAGGKAEFHDAFWSSDPVMTIGYPGGPADGKNFGYWDPDRHTCVGASVVIDRRTRTAQDKKLVHEEYVPPGVAFRLVITAQDLDDGEVALLIAAVNGFDEEDDPVTLGASSNDGWGRLASENLQIRCIDHDAVREWLQRPDAPVTAAFRPVSGERERGLFQSATRMCREAAESASIVLDIRLRFLTRLLINDPSRTGKAPRPSHAAMRDLRTGQGFLPGKSIRGRFRAQAERILRTVGPRAINLPGRDPTTQSKPVNGIEEARRKLPFIGKLFGATGWRRPVWFTAFSPDPDVPGSAGVELHQEHVAADRWYGGGSEHRKFDSNSIYGPVLRGRLRVDLAALDRCHADPRTLGLVARTVQDLLEGDIRFGLGSTRGNGECRGEIVGWKLPAWEDIPERYRSGLDPRHYEQARDTGQIPEEAFNIIDQWAMSLEEAKDAIP